MNDELKGELVSLADNDQTLLESVKDAGELEYEAYHPELKKLHQKNTQRAKQIIKDFGWPTITMVGEEGSDAIWLIVQHSVLEPEFMASCVPLLEAQVKAGEAKGWHLAFLTDRTLLQQDLPQIYGTQHVLNESDELEPYQIADMDTVDEKRMALGLETLEERTSLLRADREKVLAARQYKS